MNFNDCKRWRVCAALGCAATLAAGGVYAKPSATKSAAPAAAKAAAPASGKGAAPSGVQQPAARGFGGAPAAGAPRGFSSAPASGAPRTFGKSAPADGASRTFGGAAAHSGPDAGAGRHFGEVEHPDPGHGDAHRAFGVADEHHVFGVADTHRAFGATAGHFTYHGHEFAARHGEPYRWPHGYSYRRYAVGYRLPRALWIRDYYVYDYGAFGLDAPGAGFQWVRYGPDLLLISLATGAIVQTVYSAYD